MHSTGLKNNTFETSMEAATCYRPQRSGGSGSSGIDLLGDADSDGTDY